MNPLKQLEQCGQSPWLDYVKRSLIASGELKVLIERDGLKGVTSNPSIFEKAIGGSDEYVDSLKAFQSERDHSISAIYEHLAIADIQAGADVLRSVYDATGGADGFISLECSPYLANDTQATIDEALRLWNAVDRPNLMVKVPGTEAGIPAIRQLIGRGLNINVTLLFSVEMYKKVCEAYIAGLEDLARAGGDVAKVASVASFFVSRIDSAVDKLLDQLADKAAADRLRGKTAIANAKIAYEHYKTAFSGTRWEKLATSGAKTQRLLWASTSTKNPAYKDTMYVEALIGRDTVDTIPPATMDAYRDHGQVIPDAVEHDLDGAKAELAELGKHGISLDKVTADLVEDGVRLFADAFDELLAAVARRRRTLFEGDRAALTITVRDEAIKKAIQDELEAWRKAGRIRRLWAGNGALWTSADEEALLGWLQSTGRTLDHDRFLETTRQMVRACADDVPPVENPAVQLGVALGVCAGRFGRNKAAIVAAPLLKDVGAALERSLAQGRGLVSAPVAEPIAADRFGRDQIVVYLALDGKECAEQLPAIEALEKAGQPVVRIPVKDEWHAGQPVALWKIATAVANAVIGTAPA